MEIKKSVWFIFSSIIGSSVAFCVLFVIKSLFGNVYYNVLSNTLNVYVLLTVIDLGLPQFLYSRFISTRDALYIEFFRLVMLVWALIITLFYVLFIIFFGVTGTINLEALVGAFIFIIGTFWGGLIRSKLDVEFSVKRSSIFRLMLPMSFYLPLLASIMLSLSLDIAILIASTGRFVFIGTYGMRMQLNSLDTYKDEFLTVLRSIPFNVSSILSSIMSTGLFVREPIMNLNPETNYMFFLDIYNKLLVLPSSLVVLLNKYRSKINGKIVNTSLLLCVIIFFDTSVGIILAILVSTAIYLLYNQLLIDDFTNRGVIVNRQLWQIVLYTVLIFVYPESKFVLENLLIWWLVIDLIFLVIQFRRVKNE